MSKKHARIIRSENHITPNAPQKQKPKDPCFTCKLPASKCKGACTKAQRIKNGGNQNGKMEEQELNEQIRNELGIK